MGLELKFFCPRWGSESLGLDDFFRKVKGAGYDGVEYAIAGDTTIAQLDEIWIGAARYGLLLIAQHYDTYESNYDKHFEAHGRWFEKLRGYPVVKVNSQTGKDYFSFEQNKSLIDLTSAFSAGTGIEVCHETHRNKFSFAAHITRQYLQGIPDLNITFDVSHWICVAESYLQDQLPAVEIAIARTGHIHARVGYPEGPQIPDPRVPEWQDALNVHLNFWDQVVAFKEKQNHSLLTISPEFGPYPYLVELPGSRRPIADQWDINVWMMRLLKERYKLRENIEFKRN